MTTAFVKRVIRIGGSLAIILPSKWASGRVKPGQEMIVIGNGELRILPVEDGHMQAQHGTDADSNR